MFGYLKARIGNRIRRSAGSAELSNRINDLERRLNDLNHRFVNSNEAADLVFLSELRLKAYIHEALTVPIGPSSDLGFLSDEMYQEFETWFRGSEDEIRSRQLRYLPMLAPICAGQKIADIGCGRGEWLDIARQHGFDAVGVDVNSIAVDACRTRGHNVVELDARSFLQSVEPSSLSLLTMFQVAEHLPLNELFEVLGLARIALKPGGLFLIEIPNISSIGTAGPNFWLDPTHRRPLHAELVRFLAIQAGFRRAELIFPDSLGVTAPDLLQEGQNNSSRIFDNPDVAIAAWV